MNTFEVEVGGEKYEVRSSSMGEAAKQGILAYLASGERDQSQLSLTVRIKQTPRIRRVE